MYFLSLSPCWFFTRGGEWHKSHTNVPYKRTFWCIWPRSDAWCVRWHQVDANSEVAVTEKAPPQLGRYIDILNITRYPCSNLCRYIWSYTGFKDGSSSMTALYVESSTVCGFFLSWQGASPQYHEHSVWGCVGFYTIHSFLDLLVESQFKSFLKLIISFLVSHNTIIYQALQVLSFIA